ncbi:hypothetical protein CHH27_14840 [Labrenzia sp. VG12]|nr:hypothetical protein CHH27_14840 [Labrenzia sp. VG12]
MTNVTEAFAPAITFGPDSEENPAARLIGAITHSECAVLLLDTPKRACRNEFGECRKLILPVRAHEPRWAKKAPFGLKLI